MRYCSIHNSTTPRELVVGSLKLRRIIRMGTLQRAHTDKYHLAQRPIFYVKLKTLLLKAYFKFLNEIIFLPDLDT
jgi:hypothetical protein